MGSSISKRGSPINAYPNYFVSEKRFGFVVFTDFDY